MTNSQNAIRAGAYLVELVIVAAAFWAIGFACIAGAAILSGDQPAACETDSECAALFDCAQAPACDGGPVSAV